MKDIVAVVKKEWHGFAGSEKGIFAIYIILIFVWSFLPLNNSLGSFALSGSIWWLFFSVIVTGNFASSIFVSERLNGSMEILLTSGLSRIGVLAGKILFVVIMSVVIGILCFGLSLCWVFFSGHSGLFPGQSFAFAFLLYLSGTFMNATAGAWMSIRMSSPRLIPFVNILLVGIVCAVYYALSGLISLSSWTLVGLLCLAGCIFCFTAIKDFNGEKIIAPIDV